MDSLHSHPLVVHLSARQTRSVFGAQLEPIRAEFLPRQRQKKGKKNHRLPPKSQLQSTTQDVPKMLTPSHSVSHVKLEGGNPASCLVASGKR